MSHQIIKQPNGKYAIWSSIVDDFILINATPEQIIADRVEHESEKITEQVNRIITALAKGEKPYYQFTRTFDDAVKEIKTRNKSSSSLKILKEMKLIK